MRVAIASVRYIRHLAAPPASPRTRRLARLAKRENTLATALSWRCSAVAQFAIIIDQILKAGLAGLLELIGRPALHFDARNLLTKHELYLRLQKTAQNIARIHLNATGDEVVKTARI